MVGKGEETPPRERFRRGCDAVCRHGLLGGNSRGVFAIHQLLKDISAELDEDRARGTEAAFDRTAVSMVRGMRASGRRLVISGVAGNGAVVQ